MGPGGPASPYSWWTHPGLSCLTRSPPPTCVVLLCGVGGMGKASPPDTWWWGSDGFRPTVEQRGCSRASPGLIAVLRSGVCAQAGRRP